MEYINIFLAVYSDFQIVSLTDTQRSKLWDCSVETCHSLKSSMIMENIFLPSVDSHHPGIWDITFRLKGTDVKCEIPWVLVYVNSGCVPTTYKECNFKSKGTEGTLTVCNVLCQCGGKCEKLHLQIQDLPSLTDWQLCEVSLSNAGNMNLNRGGG